MKKKILFIIFSITFLNSIFADTGIYQSYVIVNNNASILYYDAQADTGNTDFNGANLGSFFSTETLALNGGEIKTWKSGTGDITGAYLYYRIYKDGETPSSFTAVNLPWSENDVDGSSNNQKWEETAANINLLNGLSAGNYYLEIYFQATSNEGNLYSNNSGSNYIASFSILEASLDVTSTSSLTEDNLDTSQLNLELTNDTFIDITLDTSNFTLENAPTGTSIEQINYIDTSNATLLLAFDGTDFDSDIANFGVTINASELTNNTALSETDLTITAIVEDEIVFNGMVTITPSYPTRTEEVYILFDATGTDLENATKVYLHSGVATNEPLSTSFNSTVGNWGEDDGIGEMTQIGTSNQWEITLTSIDNYYSLITNDDAFALNFLFRDENGSNTEDNSGSNYHLDIDPGNYFLITNPTYNPFLVETSQNFNIEGEASSSANWTLIELDENGVVLNANVYSETTQNLSVSHSLSDIDITHYYEIQVDFGTETKSKYFEVVAYGNIVSETMPSGAEKGINYNFPNTNEVTLVLHTPTSTTYSYYDSSNCTNTSTASTAAKEVVHLIGDFNNWEILSNYQLKNDGDYWWITLDTSTLTENEYVFQYLVDGEIRIGDPYTNKISDSDDQYISSEIYPNLISYPSDKTSGRASVLELNKTEYTWQVESFDRAITSNNLNVYELHFRDFTEEGTYKAATEKLDYIEDLGINCIHVMPVSEFEGNNSWGYNPNYYFALDKAYGTANDLKEFIDEAHKRGIAVVNDLVLNHAFYSNPMAILYWNNELNQPADDSPYFNPEHKGIYDTSGHWGADWNHSSEHTQNMVDDILNYWIEEFKFDGFRFDFTKGFTQTDQDSDDPWASSYDTCRIAILERMVSTMWANHPGTYPIFEHLANDDEDKELADYGILMWSGSGPQDSWLEMAMGTNTESFWTSTSDSRDFSYDNYMSYMESHDEERLGYKVITWGADNDGTDSYLSNRAKLPAAFNLLIPGPRMVWQFGELGYDISIDENGRTGEKTSAWELNYDENSERQEIYNFYSHLFYFRNNFDLYHARTDDSAISEIDFGNIGSETDWVRRMSFSDATDNGVHEQTQVIVVGNFDTSDNETVTPGYYYTGDWYKYNGDSTIDGTKFTVSSTSDTFSLTTNDPVYILSNVDIIDPKITTKNFEIESTSSCNYIIPTDDTQYDITEETWIGNTNPSEGHASDNGTLEIYYTNINGVDFTEKPTSLAGYTLEIGENTIIWEAVDSFGNSNSATQTITVTTNASDPTVSVLEVSPIATNSNTTIFIENPNANYIYSWYASENALTFLSNGVSFTTENLTETTSFWVQALDSETLCTSSTVEIVVEVSATLSLKNYTQTLLTAYPNPSKTSIQIELPSSINSDSALIEMYNIQGQIVLSKKINISSRFINLNIEHLPNNLYIARINLDKLYQVKILKN